MRKAVCYIRVSTIEQSTQGVSLEAQEERLLAYCSMAKLEVMAMIREEGISGAKPLGIRPGGIELLALVATKKVGHIVALKLDRLFRDAADALHQSRDWDKAGIALHLVDMGGQSFEHGLGHGAVFPEHDGRRRRVGAQPDCRTNGHGPGPQEGPSGGLCPHPLRL